MPRNRVLRAAEAPDYSGGDPSPFRGYGGQDIRGWLRVPAGHTGPLPAVVQYVGYGGGRGHALESLLWASAGFAHLHMDTRGQGAAWSVGDTPDPAPAGPQVPGVMTRTTSPI